MKRIFCLGEVLIDFISSDGLHFLKKFGGAPANVCAVAQAYTAQTYFLGQVGNDSYGDFLKTELEAYDVDTSMFIQEGQTSFAFVSVDEEGERDFEFRSGSDQNYPFTAIDQDLIKPGDIIHFGSATAFLKGRLEKTYFELLKFGIKNRNFISFDPNYREGLIGDDSISVGAFKRKSLHFIKYVNLVKLSEEELFLITGFKNPEKGLLSLREDSAAILIVTLGAKGSLTLYQDEFLYLSSDEIEQIDSTGAGDAFVGCLLAQIATKNKLDFNTLKKYLVKANSAGAQAASYLGALTFLSEETFV